MAGTWYFVKSAKSAWLPVGGNGPQCYTLGMSHAIKERVRIKPGGVIEISHPDLPPVEEAEVIVVFDPTVGRSVMEPANDSGRPIWEIIEEVGAQVPDSEWAKVPQDLAKNLDHYLYGAPKQEE